MTLVYSLTEAGAAASSAADGQSEVPLEYRRLLRLINAGGHIDVLRGRLRRFTDQMIDDWLKELEDQKMLESNPAGKLEDFTFTGRKAPRLPAHRASSVFGPRMSISSLDTKGRSAFHAERNTSRRCSCRSFSRSLKRADR